ncbi:hypothetical protein N0V82_006158 [Gnomoniopsis sp. IMI 355080]|nr:hypothetical protein N0V82_006158 [Gnomoniopsis sp. IMI 355080]
MLFRVCGLLLALGSLLPPTLAFDFVNPASHGGQSSFAQNSVYAEKSILEIQWTEPETWQDATVALYQVDITKTSATDVSPSTIGDLEYIAEGQGWNRTSRRWIVVTNKDLTVSPVFVMLLFVTGAETASDETIYFNITSTETACSTASASATASASSTASTASSSSSPTTTSAAASGSTSSDSSSDLSSSAKVGLGVGIPAAAIAGVLACWLALRRRQAAPNGQPNVEGQYASNGAHPPEEKHRIGSDGSTVASPRPASSTVAYTGPAPNPQPVQGPVPGGYRPVSGRPLYEANGEHFAVNELDAPHNTRY